jgi:hypothetical protein
VTASGTVERGRLRVDTRRSTGASTSGAAVGDRHRSDRSTTNLYLGEPGGTPTNLQNWDNVKLTLADAPVPFLGVALPFG